MSSKTTPKTPTPARKIVVHPPATQQDSEREQVRRTLVQELEALLVQGSADSSLVIGAQSVAKYLAETGEEDVARALRELIA